MNESTADAPNLASGIDDSTDRAIEQLESSDAHRIEFDGTELGGWGFLGIHPIGWTAAGVLLLAVVYSTVLDTEHLIGNFGPGYWLFFVALVALAVKPVALHTIRVGIEAISTVTRAIAWVLAWAVFVFQFINVVTRYGNDLVERDILYGEVVSLAAQSFALMFLLGIGYGMRDGVNPRIDFWWADFRPKTKAWLDFVLHAALLFPFVWMAFRILKPYTATSLGRRFNGDWPKGGRVWESWEQSTDAGQLPVGPIKAMILVAFVLLGLQIIAEMIKTGFIMMGNAKYGELKESDAPLRIE